MTGLAEPGQERGASWSIRRFLPKTLFGRTLLIIVTPLILMQVISTFVFFDRHWDTITRKLSGAVAADVALIIDSIVNSRSQAEVERIVDRARRNLDMNVSFERGGRLSRTYVVSSFAQTTRWLAWALDWKIGKPFDIDGDSVPARIILHIQLSNGLLSVNFSERRLYSSSYSVFLMWMLGSSLILFTIAIVFMRNQIRSVRRLADAAHRFGIGRDVADFEPEGALEVRQAAEAFRQMQQRIRTQLRQRTDMLAGVSHDLRTPLTRMKLQLAILGENETTTHLQSDVDDMERMVEAYLSFARGEGTEPTTPMNIVELLTEIVATTRRHGSEITLTVESGQDLEYEARQNALKRAITNLVNNAETCSSRIAVSLVVSGPVMRITVDDNGNGIPPEHREDVFKAFFRLDASRNPATGGVGLGLTISRDIIRGHGGELTLDASPLGGLRAQITLPV